MSKIRAPFYTARDWYIVQPTLYRYFSNEKWADLFFETGELWLSSFDAFRTHQDEQQGDIQEGELRVKSAYIQPGGTPAYLSARGKVPNNAYILCGAMSNDTSIASDFKAAGGIVIHDTTRFAKAVGHHIPGYMFGAEGPCNYAHMRSIDRDFGTAPTFPKDTEPYADRTRTRDAIALAWLGERLNVHPYYVKHPKFKHQLEYRLIWVTDRGVTGHLSIKVPEARVYCQRALNPLGTPPPSEHDIT